MIDETPRYGAGDAKIAFCHPKGTDGVLLELSERKQKINIQGVVLCHKKN